MSRIGLALGGGGAKGLAHVLMLEALEEMGLEPYRIVGTSIGAVFGAACASGVGAQFIRQRVDELLAVEGIKLRELLFKRDTRKVLEFLSPRSGTRAASCGAKTSWPISSKTWKPTPSSNCAYP